MSKRRFGSILNIVLVLAAGAALSACTTAEAVLSQPAPETTGSTSKPVPSATAAATAPAVPMTREKASTDCWMKYEKEGRGLSLEKRLPLVEKCTAEKLKAGR